MPRNLILNTLLGIAIIVAVATPSRALDPAGAVYAMTNALDDNEILIYQRAADGTLTFQNAVSTDGMGIGNLTEPEDALGSQSPLLLSPNGRWLFAVNAGSDEISVFEVRRDGLTLVDKVPSGGPFPASLTVYWNLLYVLNSGNDGNITGFTVGPDGHLTPIPGSTRSLDAGGVNPPLFIDSPAQVAFSAQGNELVVTIKSTRSILVFPVDKAGLPSTQPIVNTSVGALPFGIAFDPQGHMLVAEPGSQAVSSYEINADGTLEVITGSEPNGQAATCWIVTDGRFAYTTNNGADTISAYRVGPDGSLTLVDAAAGLTGGHPVDLAMSRDGRFLYNVNAGSGTLSMFAVDPGDGSLISLGEIGGLPADDGAVGIAAR